TSFAGSARTPSWAWAHWSTATCHRTPWSAATRWGARAGSTAKASSAAASMPNASPRSSAPTAPCTWPACRWQKHGSNWRRRPKAATTCACCLTSSKAANARFCADAGIRGRNVNERIREHEQGMRASDGGPRFVLVAGEASGDALGADLVQALRRRFPDAHFAGIGGDAMRAAGMQTWHDASELAVMGLAEVLRHLPRLLRLRREFRERALAWRPDVVIGIDAPDFNLPVERWFKRRGIATVHYVSPSVWAWREKRAEKIGASADRVLCLFPMEPDIYARYG